jgi:CubicO group peptidase (beta-lactamase class C family)
MCGLTFEHARIRAYHGRVQRRKFLRDGGRAALGFGALFFSGCSSRTPNALKDEFLESLVATWEAGIPQWLRETKMPAVSIAIIRDGQLAWRRAFGVKDTGTNEPVDTDSVFAACSDTKPVFAYGVLKLCEKGLLSLDTPLTKYTKRRLTKDPRLDVITARHVLNHTTGFPNWRQRADLPIEFTPGSRYQYSGEGFSYLQSVVEELTGTSFEDFMRDNILMPLGMTSSRISSDLDYARVAKPHDENGRRIPGKYFTPPSPAEQAEGIARYGAAAMLMTTPTDYATFLLEFLNPKPADSFRLNDASRTEMLRPQVKTARNWEGLAWALEQHEGAPTVFAHSGQDAGYYCVAAGCTERRAGLMVMLNGDTYAPFVMKMFANPVGPPPTPQTLWPDFVKRFFAA